MATDRGTRHLRRIAWATLATLLGVVLSGCITIGGGGPSRDDAVDWARTTSAEVLDAVSIDSPPTSSTERESVCTAIDYSTEHWNSWVITTVLPVESDDRAALLDRVTKAYDRDGWTVIGDDPGEIGPPSQAEFVRGLYFDASIDDQGADVTVSPDSTSVQVSVRSACYVTAGDE